MINRARLGPQVTDARLMQNLFLQPPPNYNWQGVPVTKDFQVPQNVSIYQPNLGGSGTYAQNNKKNYCKLCNMWTIEPYESHINSQVHMIKANGPYDKAGELDQFNSNDLVNQSNQHYDIPRNNAQPAEHINISPLHIPKKPTVRPTNHPYEGFNSSTQPMLRGGFTRPVLPQFNKNGQNQNKKLKIKRTMGNINQENQVTFTENNSPSSNVSEASNFDRNENTQKKLSETLKSTQILIDNPASITTNKGREMLLPVSGVYCTLCEEFFRNTDSAETNHCLSSTHLNAYEKLVKLKEPSDRKSLQPHKDDISLSKRFKASSKTSKSPERHDNIATLDNSIRLGETCNRDTSMEFEQNCSTDFQGPEFSLDFPEESEDYDE